ncbi:hypothetical protein O181_004063 [Austropuccinia psidii MF-1]|uniref:Uncharacterized protein n=1 Tax=Austropuccinia psidii MF-1 TaxID=1389203 RepID=A0A9Q3GE59_9BASI|nr:hypothetical protein [Austropuccinia psidii MF-1]
MSPAHLSDLGILRNQREERTRALRGRRSDNGKIDKMWKKPEKNPFSYVIPPHLYQRSSTIRLDRPGPNPLHQSTTQENLPMENGEENIQLGKLIGIDFNHH